MTISIKPTASGSTIEQDGSTILTVDGSGNITPSNNLYPKAPAFSAKSNSAQTISDAVYTKVLFGVELFDTNNNFDSSRFTPTVAGYYQINYSSEIAPPATVASTKEFFILIYKNGAWLQRGASISIDNAHYFAVSGSHLVYANGTTDYFEIYARQRTGTSADISPSSTAASWFSAHLVSV